MLPAADAAEPDQSLEFLVSVTHDLRSPLSAMLVLVERLRTGQAGPVTPQQEELLGMLYAAAFGASSLVRDALDLARGGTGVYTCGTPAPFSLAATWRAVRALVHPIAEERRLTLRWSGPASDVRVGHEATVQRVLLNLVTNALKYTERGAVTVTVTELAELGHVRFEVADSGTGLRAVEHPLSPSTGLGLVMCQHLLALCGSHLELVATGPTGTRLAFTLDIPCPG